jgi:hypothetical protein
VPVSQPMELTRPKAILAGSLAQRPGRGGHAWVFLQYLLGLRRLGWDVLFLDELRPGMCRDESGRPCGFARSWNVRYLSDVMRRFGLGEAFSLDYNRREAVAGLPRARVLEIARRSALLINVMGFLSDTEVLAAVSRRVFLDIDPGFGQMWRELGQADVFAGHDAFVTVGRNIGRPGCNVPTCGLNWITTPPPVVLEHWPKAPLPATGGAFTSVVSWRGAFAPVEYRGATYGLRPHEFRRFVELPRRCDQPFELALDIHPDEQRDLALLDANGWSRAGPADVAGEPGTYRSYIAGSRAEFMVAKNMYVRSRGGWFSDRSVCYLASGRPVLAQDTGLAEHYPVGEGLLTFDSLDEAVAGVRAINCDYARHCKAAREVAEACFDSDIVLARLLGALGVG